MVCVLRMDLPSCARNAHRVRDDKTQNKSESYTGFFWFVSRELKTKYR